jgi:hypothetical protein
MEQQDNRHGGFGNHETWALFALLTGCEEVLAYLLAEAAACREDAETRSFGLTPHPEAIRRNLADRLAGSRDGESPGLLGDASARIRWEEVARELLVEPPPTWRPRFPLGRLVITLGAYGTVPPLDILVGVLLHARGVWGEVDEPDAERNERALREGGELLSAYTAADGTRFYVLTEADRSATTVVVGQELEPEPSW